MDIAEFYTEWATAVKLKIELDPIKEMLRQQKYKELSDHAISLLQSQPDEMKLLTGGTTYLPNVILTNGITMLQNGVLIEPSRPCLRVRI